MALFVVNNAMLLCTGSFVPTPSPLTVIRPTVLIGGQPAATVMDFAPMANIKSFGMCKLPSNPAVAAATTAALGVLTPAPCVPATAAAWLPGNAKVLIQNVPALMSDCKCMCAYGGQISVSVPGQVTVSG